VAAAGMLLQLDMPFGVRNVAHVAFTLSCQECCTSCVMLSGMSHMLHSCTIMFWNVAHVTQKLLNCFFCFFFSGPIRARWAPAIPGEKR